MLPFFPPPIVKEELKTRDTISSTRRVPTLLQSSRTRPPDSYLFWCRIQGSLDILIKPNRTRCVVTTHVGTYATLPGTNHCSIRHLINPLRFLRLTLLEAFDGTACMF